MFWEESNRFSREACRIADTHYSRQKIGSPQFVAAGSPIVLIGRKALWVSLEQKFQDHDWKGAWNNTLFKNESGELSSELIIQACAVTRAYWGVNPHGIITMIDTKKVRWKKHFGYCYRKAGFVEVGYTKVNKLLVLKLFADKFPEPQFPKSNQQQLFDWRENFEDRNDSKMCCAIANDRDEEFQEVLEWAQQPVKKSFTVTR